MLPFDDNLTFIFSSFRFCQDGCTCLHEAVRWRNFYMVELLLNKGADPKVANKVKGWGVDGNTGVWWGS